jgi:acetate kinase
MDTILVVNAGSSSLKFQVFATGATREPRRLVKGQMDGIGTRPRLRAEAADKRPLPRGVVTRGSRRQRLHIRLHQGFGRSQ